MAEKTAYRSIWISDVHLGTPGCNADLLIDFLKHTESETLYLVGDIIDGWRLKRSWYWHPRHNDVVRQVLKKAKRGTRVIYIPGNHDEALRPYAGINIGGIEVQLDAIHHTADGRKLLVLHGDEFDSVVLYSRWLAFLGDMAYSVLLTINVWFNWARRKLNLPYWSLSAYLKNRVKTAMQFVDCFEEAVARTARERQVDGVICGHIHCAQLKQYGSVTYYNDGDWVESCTSLVEHEDGYMEILHWAEIVRARRRSATTDDRSIDVPLAEAA
jgi:UDP-2,3-diacylglucosamine pyrophosphatase LpxH